MGLDQYAVVVKHHGANTDFYIGWSSDDHSEDERTQNMLRFAVWRKHPNLQGWMEKLFNHKANLQDYTGEVAVGGLSSDQIMITGMAMNTETGQEIPIDNELEEVIKNMQGAINENLPDFHEQVLAGALPQRVFNCQPIRLNLSDLEQLETAINRGELPHTSGFFFGENADEEYKEQDLQFIKMSREAIANGFHVYYNSWW